jgi:hypothetical protein
VKYSRLILAVTLMCASSLSWTANGTQEQCRSIKNNSKRLECYDNLPLTSSKFTSATEDINALPTWDKEPDSFLSMKIDKPVYESYATPCPITTRYGGITEIDTFQWEKQGKPQCVYRRSGTNGNWAQFKGHGIEGLRNERVSLYEENVVGKVTAAFYSVQYTILLDALIQRFGRPTTTISGAMKLNNGAELPTTTNTWIGKKSILMITNLARRETYEGLTDYGELTFTSNEYARLQREVADKTTQEKAQKF